MAEQQIYERFEQQINKAREIKDFLEEMQENPEVATLGTKPILSMLVTGADYLIVNMSQLQRKHLHETGE